MTRRRSTLTLGYEETQASLDREDVVLQQRRAQHRPSTSRPLARCATCGQWPRWRETVTGTLCVGDGGPGHPFTR